MFFYPSSTLKHNKLQDLIIMKWLFLIPLLYITALIATSWANFFIGGVLAFGFFWLTIPAIILSIYIFIKSIRCTNVFQRIIVGWGIFNVLFFLVFAKYRFPQQLCSANIMAEYYEKHVKDFDDLIQSVDEALNDSTSVSFDVDFGKIWSFSVTSKKDTLAYDRFTHSKQRIDTLMEVVGLTDSELQNICKRLKDLDCSGIYMNKPYLDDSIVVVFRSYGLSTNAFLFFYRPLTQEEKDVFLYDDRYIPYNERVILRHTAPAGAETFSKEEKEEFLKNHKPW